MMAHNQFQFQHVLSKQGMKLSQCSCSRYHFPVVEYSQGKSVRIYCKYGCGIVTMERDPKVMSEDEFVKAAALRWNTGNWDKG